MLRDRDQGPSPDEQEGPDAAELLAWLDNELPPHRALQVRHAIDTSASVRARLHRVRRDSALHSELVAHELPPRMPGLDDALKEFAARLEREQDNDAAAEAALGGKVRSGRSLLTSRWLRIAACIVLSGGVAAYWLSRGPLIHVLAHDVLNHANSAEAQSYAHIPAPVVHQRIRAIRRGTNAKTESAAWELWNRLDGSESHEEVKPIATDAGIPAATVSPVVGELKEILQSNRIDPRQPLSTRAYDNWRSANRVEEALTPTITEGGAYAFNVTSTAMGSSAPDKLLQTEFTIRMSDWHIVGERIRVQAGSEVRQYELTETSYEVVSLGALPLTVFGAPAPVVLGGATGPAESSPPPVTPDPAIAWAPSTVQNEQTGIVAAAIETQYALHTLNACTDEQLTMELTNDGQIVIQGSVLNQKRWQQIVDGLSGLHARPVVHISVLDVPSSPKATSANLAISPVDRALIHATALYQISAAKYGSDISSLSRNSRWLMEIMVRDHLLEIQGTLAELRRSLGAAPVSKGETVSDSLPLWPEGAISLLQDVRTLNELLHRDSVTTINSMDDSGRLAMLRLTNALSNPAALAAYWFSAPGGLPGTSPASQGHTAQ